MRTLRPPYLETRTIDITYKHALRTAVDHRTNLGRHLVAVTNATDLVTYRNLKNPAELMEIRRTLLWHIGLL